MATIAPDIAPSTGSLLENMGAHRVLVDAATAEALGDEFDTRTLPPRPLRGFGNLSPITVSERRSFRAR